MNLNNLLAAPFWGLRDRNAAAKVQVWGHKKLTMDIVTTDFFLKINSSNAGRNSGAHCSPSYSAVSDFSSHFGHTHYLFQRITGKLFVKPLTRSFS